MVAAVGGFAGDERRDQRACGADKNTEESGAETDNGEPVALSADLAERWHPQKDQDRRPKETLKHGDGDLDKDIGPGDVVVVLGGVPKDMGALVLRLSELLA